MSIDPRLPVIVGAGQFLHRADGVDDALEPVALMERAVRLAATDAGLAGPPDADSLRIVRFLSWKYRNPCRFLAARLGIEPGEQAITTNGGNSPQTLVSATARDIEAGHVDVAILTGGEAFRTYMRARRDGVTLHWPKADDDDRPVTLGSELEMNHAAEIARGIVAPVQIYPLFESALRAESGRTVSEHQAHLGRLWSDLSRVAAANPHAWLRTPLSPEEVTEVGPDNRIIGFPYPKLMNSNNDVDMAAAVIMCSAQAATRLGVPRDRWVFPHSGTDCHEQPFVSFRDTLTRTPAIELGGARALELAGVGIDEVELIDLYSCFPSAVQLGASALGVEITGPHRRQWSRTGGLSFAGGPWNSYSLHAIATIVRELRDRPGGRGLVWANGGYVTKHAFGVYGSEPPTAGFRHDTPQAAIDALPRRDLAIDADGAGRATIEAYTVMFDRRQEPERAIASCRRADGRRTWGLSADAAVCAAMCDGEWVGVGVDVDAEGELRVA